jgi:polyisoprenoid-binding protein YceI
MNSQVLRALVIFLAIAVFAVGCATPAEPTAVPATAVPATAVPAPTNPPAPTIAPTAVPEPTTPPTAVPEPTTAPQSSNDGGLPETVAAGEGNIYSFQVVPDETTAEYAVDEVLFGNKQITRGRTNAVEGDFKLGVKDGKPFFDFSQLRVDLRTLKSDNSMRDIAIQQQYLESARFPYADFVVTSIEEFPAEASAGQEVSFKVTGDMTIREITKPITFEVTVKLDGDTLTGTGVTQIFMKDFGFSPPDILGRFTVSDPATITVTGVAKFMPEQS